MYDCAGMSTGMSSPTRQDAGFTLLEAIVAIALLGALLVPLYNLMSRNLDGLYRVGDANLQSEVTLNAMAMLETINPMERPAGSVQLGNYVLRWNSVALTAPIDGVGFPAGQSLYQVAMYQTSAEVLRVGRGDQLLNWFSFDLRQVGWKQVRQFRLPF